MSPKSPTRKTLFGKFTTKLTRSALHPLRELQSSSLLSAPFVLLILLTVLALSSAAVFTGSRLVAHIRARTRSAGGLKLSALLAGSLAAWVFTPRTMLWETETAIALPPACVHAYELATLSYKPRPVAVDAQRASFCSNESGDVDGLSPPSPVRPSLRAGHGIEVKKPIDGLPPCTTPLPADVGPQDDVRTATSAPELLIDAIDGARVSRMATSGDALMLPPPAVTLYGPWFF
ncbi:hypothetical protein C8F01DRAFT_1368077 [Mycena amicta]|nr:hypothetical protein C8F01DRAFT_1368077 [Mycena amicta]